MAKSSTGGTRAFIRGRVGSEVYCIGKDGKGTAQQVVRSIADIVSNPRTVEQQKGRMIMSTIMQAVSAMRFVIDHSFDGLPSGQPCVSEFISRNYALIKADVAAHPSDLNTFGLNPYQGKGIRPGPYVMSDGEAVKPTNVQVGSLSSGNLYLRCRWKKMDPTYADLKSLLSLSDGEYFTLVGIDPVGGFRFARCYWVEPEDLTTVMTAANFLDVINHEESNFTLTMRRSVSGSYTYFYFEGITTQGSLGVIFTKNGTDGSIHSPCTLRANSGQSLTFDEAIATYPVGKGDFINGGSV